MNINKLLQKYHSWERLLKKEETYLKKKLIEKADKLFSIFIRGRDKECITCGKPIQHNAHRISRGYYSHRWDEDNCAGACAWCNTYNQEEHKVLFTVAQIKKHWQEWVDKQLREKHKKKPTIDELLGIISKYEKSKKQVLKKENKSL